MLDEVTDAWSLPQRPVVADAGYGDATEFRLGLTERGLTYVLAVSPAATAHPADAVPVTPPWAGNGRPPGPRYQDKPVDLKTLVMNAGRSAGKFVVWRHGTKKSPGNPTASMRSRFLALRVRPDNRNIARAADGSLPECWLLAEWPPGATEPTDYWLSTLPADIRLRDLVRLAKIRWRIEHDYRELKDGLGLDHFEGRSWLGWHRHVTLAAPRPSHLHPAPPHPTSPCAGLTLYAVLRELQALLAVWTGVCHTCRQPVQTPTPTTTPQASNP
ncbi:DDE superfamily endonuclease [Lentzea jiangxiensis]|uniref:DDE superfamily endonuclease n=1 Tax=Lentzea jiangxiensis TaxID=641025 RepID=A0A1H0X7N8_9PSEU|nr:DDE superfamily endonuclease [Lentzea jiangxiensis]